uniref:GOLGA2L5 domain-containing protein n=1 Tax=Angiostrongylus cantonensis TaxID=6313 RepID=A0A0K0DRS4_ANGCA
LKTTSHLEDNDVNFFNSVDKMVQLNKSLKDAELALEASNVEKEELIQQLSNHKLSNDRINADCLTLQSELQEVRIRLHEEQCRVRELTSTVDKLQDNSNILLTTRNEERVTFEAKIARNEELLLYWQKISEQKSAELSDLLAENEMLRTRCHNLENDFISYKSRARYVLEQQAKAAVNGGAINGLNTEAVQQSLIQLMNDFEELQYFFV